jgi:hypothetical protein
MLQPDTPGHQHYKRVKRPCAAPCKHAGLENQVLPTTPPKHLEPNLSGKHALSQQVINGFRILGTEHARNIISQSHGTKVFLTSNSYRARQAKQKKKRHLLGTLVFQTSLASTMEVT